MAATCDRCGVSYGGESIGFGSDAVAAGSCPDCGHAGRALAWHVASDGVTAGPYDLEHLREAFRRGTLVMNDYVHCEGWSDWRCARDVHELRTSARTEAPLPPLPDFVRREEHALASDPVHEVFFSRLHALDGMGDDPFESSLGFADVVAADALEQTSPGRNFVHERPTLRQPAAESEWDFGSPLPPAEWDLDGKVPALERLLAPGRTVASGHAAHEEERSGVMDMASLLRAPQRVAEPTQPSFAMSSTRHAAWRIAQQRLQSARGTLRDVGRMLVQGRPPLVLLSVALAGLLIGVGSIVAWAASGGSSAGASVPQTAQPVRPVSAAKPVQPVVAAMAPVPARAEAPKPSVTPAAASAVAAVPAQREATVAAAQAAVAPAAALPAQADVAAASAAQATERALEDEAAALRAELRLTRAAAAKEARANKWRAQHPARDARGRRISAKLAGVGRSGRKSHTVALAQDDADAAPRAPKSKSDASLDRLVEGALTGKRRATTRDPLLDDMPAKAKHRAADADDGLTASLPATPSRDQILLALNKAKALVARCNGSGTATASISVRGPSGRAVKVDVEGVSGSARTCVQSAIRRTPFPKFQQETFAVRAPFKLEET